MFVQCLKHKVPDRESVQKSVAWVDAKTTAKIMGKIFRHGRSVQGQTLAKLQKSVAWVDAKTTAKIMEKIVAMAVQ